MSEEQSGCACACDMWVCPHNEEKIKHLPGVVRGIAVLKEKMEDLRVYWQEAEAKIAAKDAELARMRGAGRELLDTLYALDSDDIGVPLKWIRLGEAVEKFAVSLDATIPWEKPLLVWSECVHGGLIEKGSACMYCPPAAPPDAKAGERP